jgi:magnesium chelatase family protein
MGELSLDGSLQPIRGALPIAIKAKEKGLKAFFLPKQNVKRSCHSYWSRCMALRMFRRYIDFLEGKGNLEPTPSILEPSFIKI